MGEQEGGGTPREGLRGAVCSGGCLLCFKVAWLLNSSHSGRLALFSGIKLLRNGTIIRLGPSLLLQVIPTHFMEFHKIKGSSFLVQKNVQGGGTRYSKGLLSVHLEGALLQEYAGGLGAGGEGEGAGARAFCMCGCGRCCV